MTHLIIFATSDHKGTGYSYLIDTDDHLIDTWINGTSLEVSDELGDALCATRGKPFSRDELDAEGDLAEWLSDGSEPSDLLDNRLELVFEYSEPVPFGDVLGLEDRLGATSTKTYETGIGY